jgi:transketolase
MMAVAAGAQAVEPTISGEAYTKMIENYMDSSDEVDNYHKMANAIRFLSMDAIEAANSGHPGLPMGMADVCTVLFKDFLKFKPEDPDWPDRDRFILSAGHGSMLIYSLLYLSGYKDIRLEDIKRFRQLGSRAAGHPENFEAKGIETTTGPLGQGIANAVGMAISERILSAKYGDDIFNHYTYALCGDGCLMEGISQEAITFAAHHKLNKLIYLWDDNEITIDGRTSVATSENQQARFEAAGWHVESVDGHNVEEIKAAIAKAKTTDMPSMIACKTHIGFGAPTKVGSNGVHGAALGAKEIEGTRKNFKWEAEPFDIPKDI